MDAERFDRIARSLARRASRRRLVGGLAALGLGGVLAPASVGAQEPPGLPDGSGATTAANDPSCQGEPVINNRTCPENSCRGTIDCACAQTVSGDKRCVKIAGEMCPERD